MSGRQACRLLSGCACHSCLLECLLEWVGLLPLLLLLLAARMPAAASACVNRSCVRTCGAAGLTPSILTPTPHHLPASPPPPSPILQWLIVLGMCTHLRHVPQARASTQPGCDPATALTTTSRPHLQGTGPYNLEMPDHCLLEDGKGARGRQLSVMSWRRQQTEPAADWWLALPEARSCWRQRGANAEPSASSQQPHLAWRDGFSWHASCCFNPGGLLLRS
jgi:hypothetical protein